MLLCIRSVVLVCLKYSSKHNKLYQGLDDIVYGIDFACNTIVLKV